MSHNRHTTGNSGGNISPSLHMNVIPPSHQNQQDTLTTKSNTKQQQTRAPLASLHQDQQQIQQHKQQQLQQQQQQHVSASPINTSMQASIDTTRTSMDTTMSSIANSSHLASFNTSSASAASFSRHPSDDASSASASSSGDASTSMMECNETMDLSTSEIGNMSANYPELAARAIALASQVSLDRIHIQALTQQVDAARVWNTELEKENARLKVEKQEWQLKAEQNENTLKQTQIMLACLRETQPDAANAPLSPSAPGQSSPRTRAFESERRAQSSHHQAALDAKDTLITRLMNERDEAELALRQTRAEYSALLHTTAETRYNDALLASEQREKFQRLAEQQLEQQRIATEDAVHVALGMRKQNENQLSTK